MFFSLCDIFITGISQVRINQIRVLHFKWIPNVHDNSITFQRIADVESSVLVFLGYPHVSV